MNYWSIRLQSQKLALVLLATLILFGCGGGSENSGETTSQENTGNISGFATDSNTGAIVSGVLIKISNKETNSATDGTYELKNIEVGSTAITASKKGYQDYSGNISITKEQTTSHDIMLNPVITSEIPVNGLVAHYTFDEDANDTSDNGNNGVVNGDITFVDGVVGKAAKFDGNYDYIRIVNPSQIFSTEYSFSAFINSEGNADAIISKYSFQSVPDGFIFFISDASGSGGSYINGTTLFSITVFDQKWIQSTQNHPSINIEQNNFIHVATTYKDGVSKLYVNGELVSEKTLATTGDLDNSYDMIIGSYLASNGNIVAAELSKFSGYSYKGLIDDLLIYNRELSIEEIKNLMSRKDG